MHPIALQLGAFTIRWYGVMAAVGFLLACRMVTLNSKRVGIDSDRVSGALITALLAGVIGARIFYVVQFWEHYRSNPVSVIRVDQGGLVFYGGFLLAIAALWLYAKKYRLDFVRLLDVFTPAIAIGHACGRIGCFLNGCCFGKPCSLPWAVFYPAGSEAALHYGGVIGVHPAQLYEAAENFAVCALMLFLVRRTKPGVPLSSYLVIYGALRFINEFWRGDNPHVFNLFTPAQLIGLVLIPAGAALLFWFSRHERKEN